MTPSRVTVKNVISVSLSVFRIAALKLFHRKTFHATWIQRISPSVDINIGSGKLTLGKRIRAHSGVRISCANGGKITIGDNVAINVGCIITSHEGISIGSGTEIGPYVLLYDHDHDYRVEGGLKAGMYKTGAINVGKNVWIGAQSIILRNTNIGDNAVIAAGSIVSGTVVPGSVFIQKRTIMQKQAG